jgi:periplasmic protein TonB
MVAVTLDAPSPEERIAPHHGAGRHLGRAVSAALLFWLGILAILYALPSRQAPEELSPVAVELRMLPPAEESVELDIPAADPAPPVSAADFADAVPPPSTESAVLATDDPPASAPAPEPRPAMHANPPPIPRTKPRSPSVAAAPEASGTSVAALPSVPTRRDVEPRAATDYASLLLAQLTRHQDYPRAARLRGLEGKVVLRLVIARDGRVVEVAVRTSSGKDLLDAGALSTVTRAGRLPPLPPELAGETAEFVVPVVFSLSRS